LKYRPLGELLDHLRARARPLPCRWGVPPAVPMPESGFDWNGSYVLRTTLRFRPTPASASQVDGDAEAASIEVPRELVALLLAFARPQSPRGHL
jgi:hypothetical protein